MPSEPFTPLRAAARALPGRRAVGIALVAVALTGGSAQAARLITGGDIAPGTITGRNVKDGSISGQDLGRTAVERLSGAQGPAGQRGPQGPVGPKGEAGPVGAHGPQGEAGAKGDTGAAGERGLPGPQGPRGFDGFDGQRGPRGRSAYRVWLDAGNTGDEAAFLASLTGPKGADATALIAAVDGDAAGTVLFGSHLDAAAPVTHGAAGSGIYDVKFDQAVAACAYSVTGRGAVPSLFTASPHPTDLQSVRVTAFSPAGEPVDAAFSVAVFCG